MNNEKDIFYNIYKLDCEKRLFDEMKVNKSPLKQEDIIKMYKRLDENKNKLFDDNLVTITFCEYGEAYAYDKYIICNPKQAHEIRQIIFNKEEK